MRKKIIVLLILPLVLVGGVLVHQLMLDSLNGLVYVWDGIRSVDSFCTTEDIRYQTIVRDSQDWIDYFSSSMNRWIQFDVPIRRRYTANENYDSASDDMVIFVQTRSGWPNDREGSEGYLYIPSGNKPAGDWALYYDLNYLDNNVYCYDKK